MWFVLGLALNSEEDLRVETRVPLTKLAYHKSRRHSVAVELTSLLRSTGPFTERGRVQKKWACHSRRKISI